jgi:hypothetical protein
MKVANKVSKLINVLTIALALMAIVTAVLWVRSFWVDDFIFFRLRLAPPSGETGSFISNCGRIKIGYQGTTSPRLQVCITSVMSRRHGRS